MDMTTGTVVFHERIVVDGKLAAFDGEAMTAATAIARGIDLAKYGYGDEPEKPDEPAAQKMSESAEDTDVPDGDEGPDEPEKPAAKPRKAAKPDKADE